MTLPRKISEWPEIWREAYEERAGIMEHQGGMTKSWAEFCAERDIRRIEEKNA